MNVVIHYVLLLLFIVLLISLFVWWLAKKSLLMKNTSVTNYVWYSLFGDKSAKNIAEEFFMFAPIEIMDFICDYFSMKENKHIISKYIYYNLFILYSVCNFLFLSTGKSWKIKLNWQIWKLAKKTQIMQMKIVPYYATTLWH